MESETWNPLELETFLSIWETTDAAPFRGEWPVPFLRGVDSGGAWKTKPASAGELLASPAFYFITDIL